MVKNQEKLLEKLNKEREDIELLLSSLEETYAEAGITEKNYREIKEKNEKKLEEIMRKIEEIKKKQHSKKRKRPKKAEKEISETPPETTAQPVTEIPKETPAPEPKPEEPKLTKEDIKQLLATVVKEAKLVDIAEISPKIEKLSIQLEKLKAFVDAIREERDTTHEKIQRIAEELGELRSDVHSNERRLSEQEIKLKDMDSLISNLKPQRFTKIMSDLENEIKKHEARIMKLEDLSSEIIKRVSNIKEILENLGSIEHIANISREVNKKFLKIEEKERKIIRLADKIDGIFAELNKRLDEFIFYKAKQDTLNELVNEMMKTLDEINTKMERFVERTELEVLRDTLEAKIAEMRPEASEEVPETVKNLEERREEIKGLLEILEEQYKTGAISEEEYKKAKEENMKMLREIEEKINAERSKQVSSETETSSAEEKSPTVTKPELETIKNELEKAGSILGGLDVEKETPQITQETEKLPSLKSEPEKEAADEPEDPKKKMLLHLEDSFKKGLISKEAYERTKKIIESRF